MNLNLYISNYGQCRNWGTCLGVKGCAADVSGSGPLECFVCATQCVCLGVCVCVRAIDQLCAHFMHKKIQFHVHLHMQIKFICGKQSALMQDAAGQDVKRTEAVDGEGAGAGAEAGDDASDGAWH